MTGDETTSQARRPRWTWLLIRFAVVAALAGVIPLWLYSSRPTLPDGVVPSQYESAAKQFRRSFGRDPGHVETLMMVGESALQNRELTTALAAFQAVPDDDLRFRMIARLQEAQVLVALNRARDAESIFRRCLALAREEQSDEANSSMVTANKWLAFLYSVELRFDERRAVLAALHESQQMAVSDSKQYFFPRLLIWKSSSGRSRLNKFLEQDPDDLLLNVARGRYLTGAGRLNAARQLLESLIQEFPAKPCCIAAVLECYYEQNDWVAIAELLGSVAPYNDSEPHLLTWIRAEFAVHEERWDDAVIEFKRALQADASNPATHMGLAKAYGRLGRLSEQHAAQQRSLVLSRIRVGMARNNERSFEPLLELAEQCRQIGMTEAAAVFAWHGDRIRRQLEAAEPELK
jgi:tetratricopeptide (TPR) repeat protein